MKVCIIGIQNIKHMTLISMYTEYFKKNEVKYDIIYIDKYGVNEDTGAENVYKFNGMDSKYKGNIGKLLKSIRFKIYTENILKNNSYDFIVVWREQTAFMFSFFLKRYYKGRYSVNIRDLWDLQNKILTYGIKIAVQNSAFNTVSSEGFIKYLPDAKYLMIHSANKKILMNGFEVGEKKEMPIKITYIGTLRFYDYCVNLIKAFNNDDRFVLEFIGQGSEEIEKYCNENNYINVLCSGAFSPEDTNDKLKGTHVINCAFGTKKLAERMLTPIRFYYAVSANIPVLTAEGTWLDELAKKYEMAITVPNIFDCNTRVNDVVMNEYMKKDFNRMKIQQEKLNQIIIKSYNDFYYILDSVLNLVREG